jgi:hypothetical protein
LVVLTARADWFGERHQRRGIFSAQRFDEPVQGIDQMGQSLTCQAAAGIKDEHQVQRHGVE